MQSRKQETVCGFLILLAYTEQANSTNKSLTRSSEKIKKYILFRKI